MLQNVDRPFAVRKVDGSYAEELIEKIPSITKTQKIGPAGWSESITGLIG
jgi:hypothetical protein